MNIKFFLEAVGMFLIPLLVVLIPIVIGQRYGSRRSKKLEEMMNKFFLTMSLLIIV